MGLGSSEGNESDSGDDDDGYLEIVRNGDKKGRNYYIYTAIAFTIFAIMATLYLAILIFSGPFSTFNGIEWIINQIPHFDNTLDESEFEGYSDRDVILLCCTWGEELADGELTYFIGDHMIDQGAGENSRNEVDESSLESVTSAFEEWDSKIEGLTISESPVRRTSDIEIYFQEGKNEKAGITNHYYDHYGFITKSYVLISQGAFGFGFTGDQIEQIAKHEIGHVLGLGHANFDGNLMAAQVNRGSGSVSNCEVDAVYSANEWWFKNQSGSQPLFMRQPTADHINCR
jgi:hypothetical protein